MQTFMLYAQPRNILITTFPRQDVRYAGSSNIVVQKVAASSNQSSSHSTRWRSFGIGHPTVGSIPARSPSVADRTAQRTCLHRGLHSTEARLPSSSSSSSSSKAFVPFITSLTKTQIASLKAVRYTAAVDKLLLSTNGNPAGEHTVKTAPKLIQRVLKYVVAAAGSPTTSCNNSWRLNLLHLLLAAATRVCTILYNVMDLLKLLRTSSKRDSSTIRTV